MKKSILPTKVYNSINLICRSSGFPFLPKKCYFLLAIYEKKLLWGNFSTINFGFSTYPSPSKKQPKTWPFLPIYLSLIL